MGNNIKYIRWAAKVFRYILVINLILGVITFIAATFGIGLIVVKSPVAAPIGFSIDFGALIAIIVNAFITYTVARGLELFADVAERVEVIRRNQWEQMTGIKQQYPTS